MFNKQNNKENNFQKKKTDIKFVKKIQPQGGMTFDDNHIVGGDGYYSCLTINSYPKNPDFLWLIELMNSEYTIGSLDIATDNKNQLRGQMNRSLTELRDRTLNANRATDQEDARNEYAELLAYSNNINQGHEVPKKVVVRIFVYGSTQEQLEERVSNLRDQLKGSGFEASTYLFMQDKELKSLGQNFSQQQKEFTAIPYQPIPATTLGMGAPFNNQSLNDPHGIYLGYTKTGGAFIFDQFASIGKRRSYNMMVLGKMGSGKSTTLKMLEEGSFARNMYVRAIDKTKEYEGLVRSQDGVVVNLDGSEGMINPLQVEATVTDATGLIVDEVASFYQHINKVSTQFRMINNNELSHDAIREFETFLKGFYVAFGLLPADFQSNRQNVHITGLDPKKYPKFSDFSNWLKETINDQFLVSQGATVARREAIESVKLSVESMIDSYGQMFDGYSTMSNLADEKVVVFDSSSVSQMNENIYQAQLYSALNLIWSHALKNGRRQKYFVQEKGLDPDYIDFFNVILDECHNIINAKNLFAVDYIVNFEREMRKFSAGVIFATQSLQEMVPDNVETAALSSLKTVFELCQYKMIMMSDPAQMSKMRQVLEDSLTEHDYAKIPNFERGEAIVVVGGDSSYTIKTDPNDRQLKVFDGGR